MSAWKIVWDIAERRDETRRGSCHLSPHGMEALVKACINENATMLAKVLTGRFAQIRI